jgi:hypothetical protein
LGGNDTARTGNNRPQGTPAAKGDGAVRSGRRQPSSTWWQSRRLASAS